MRYLKYIKIIVLILLVRESSAQGFNATGLSMANAFTARARGIEAVAWNPANLMLPRDGKLEINLVGFNLNVANSSFTLDDYQHYFTESGHNGTWSVQDRNDLLSLIPDDGLLAAGDIRFNAMGIAMGNFALSVQGVGKMLGVFPKAPVELVLFGNQNLNKVYRFDDLDGNGFAAIKVSFAGAFEIPFSRYFDHFGVGIGLHYYRGIATIQKQEASGALHLGSDALVSDMNLEARSARGGSGFGFDLGAAGIIRDKWTVSVALKNIAAGINWNAETEYLKTSVRIDSLRLNNADSTTVTETDTSYAIDGFRTDIPIVFQAGVSYQALRNLLVTMELEQAFKKAAGYSDQGRVALGLEYIPFAVLPLRTGFSYGGNWGFTWGLGFGLHFPVLQFDFGYAMYNAILPAYSSGVSAAANIKFSF
jgi:hypothetical protein